MLLLSACGVCLPAILDLFIFLEPHLTDNDLNLYELHGGTQQLDGRYKLFLALLWERLEHKERNYIANFQRPHKGVSLGLPQVQKIVG